MQKLFQTDHEKLSNFVNQIENREFCKPDSRNIDNLVNQSLKKKIRNFLSYLPKKKINTPFINSYLKKLWISSINHWKKSGVLSITHLNCVKNHKFCKLGRKKRKNLKFVRWLKKLQISLIRFGKRSLISISCWKRLLSLSMSHWKWSWSLSIGCWILSQF